MSASSLLTTEKDAKPKKEMKSIAFNDKVRVCTRRGTFSVY